MHVELALAELGIYAKWLDVDYSRATLPERGTKLMKNGEGLL